jgi:nucleoside-diphosphate-sugar epimerase
MNSLPQLQSLTRIASRLSGTRILVTGAGGFIGSAVLKLLAALPLELRALLGAPGDPIWNPPSGTMNYWTDIRDLSHVTEAMRGVDVVIHGAGPPSVRNSFSAPAECAAVHILGTVTVLQASQLVGVKRVIYISSAEVYGRPIENSVSAAHVLHPISPYGAAKAACEYFVMAMASASAMESVILRPFSILGPRLSRDSVVATILRQARHDEYIWVNNLHSVRDYCFVYDLADAIVRACCLDIPGSILNIGSGTGTSVAEIARIALKLFGRDIPIRQCEVSDRPTQSDIPLLIANVERADSTLQWRTKTTLEQGLVETMQWLDATGYSS